MKEYEKIYIYILLNYFAVYQKLHYKSTIFKDERNNNNVLGL